MSAKSGTIADVLALLHDPVFVAFELSQEAPTIFNAVGRTHTETWHSALMGWLFDPQSSHNLGSYPLSRLLILLQTRDILENIRREIDLREVIAVADFSNACVRPNERELFEVSVPNVGRFDVLIDQIKLKPWNDIQILIEVKVNAPINVAQCTRYIAHIESKRTKGVYILPVFIAPQQSLIGTSEELFGDERWIALSYQDIYDDVIDPCLQHQNISPFGLSTLNEYVKTLKYKQKGDKSLAITQKDRELAKVLFDKHEPAIKVLYEILSQSMDDIDSLSADISGTKSSDIKIQVNGRDFIGSSISRLYSQVLKYLVDGNYLDGLEIPVPSGSKRYLIANEPKHQQGNEFLKPVSYKSFHMEANKSRDTGLSDLAKLVHLCGLSFRIVP